MIDGIKGSFEKGSLIDKRNIDSLIGSLVMQDGEVDARDVQARLNSERLMLEDADGTPQVHEYQDDDGLPLIGEVQIQSDRVLKEDDVIYEGDRSLETISQPLTDVSPTKYDPVAQFMIQEQPLENLFKVKSKEDDH